MTEAKYQVIIDDTIAARYMTLDDALIFIKGIFETYYNETELCVSIKQEKLENEEHTIQYAFD